MTSSHKYLTAPIPSTEMPPGVPYIVGNEAAERFSYYGMRTILVVFMTQYLCDSHGMLAVMDQTEAMEKYHSFLKWVYLLSIMGALLSDGFLGKYRTILSLSIVYCFGHLALALDETRRGLYTGLILIAIGAGGIKPCVSANVGDQFNELNKHLLEKVFGWFYFAINLGAFFSTLLTPALLAAKGFGPRWAFGVPGVLMFLATLVFWLGRNKFVHIPPGGLGFVREAFSAEGLWIIARLCLVYVFVAVFWCLYDQTGSAWVFQAEKMNRTLFPVEWFPAWPAWWPEGLRIEWMVSWLWKPLLAAQIQAINPILILIYMPLFEYAIYPLVNRVFPLTALRKISIGFFVTVIAFAISALIEMRISAGQTPSIGWQVVAYMVLTAAEVMVSITCLEFSYTQAPPKMKSLVMAIFLASVALGNTFTEEVNRHIKNADGTSRLPGATYYWFFTGAMLVAACLFIVVAGFYKEKTYIQESKPAD